MQIFLLEELVDKLRNEYISRFPKETQKVLLADPLRMTAEDTAMLQALYSRSSRSVQDHIRKVLDVGSGKFMESFYVGYGHASIGDCGSTTIFIENISILADKALQDNPLYSGQETSTRYVDMEKQEILNPIGTREARSIQDDWMEFYSSSKNPVSEHLREVYPKKEGEEEKMYEKAIQARTFDTLRAFLPAGICTQLSWHTNLRQAWDKLVLMKEHPVPEIKKIAENILLKLKSYYPHSFNFEPTQEQTLYRNWCMRNYAYFDPDSHPEFKLISRLEKEEIRQYKKIFSDRPPKTLLPIFLGELGNLQFDFLLDYGSFRDIQRHRNGTCRIPLLTTKFGFHSWYLKELPDMIRIKAEKLINNLTKKIDLLDAPKEIIQYYVAMGFQVPCRVSYGLMATVYTIELRSSKPVHPTLRSVAHKMHKALTEKHPEIILHSDLDPSDWDARRGLQDIIEKK